MVNITRNFSLINVCMKHKMLEYDRIDISEGIDTNKTSASKECKICHSWYFLDKNFNYEPYLCNKYHDLMQKAISFKHAAIVSITLLKGMITEFIFTILVKMMLLS